MAETDLYAVLGVDRTAPQADIRKAYRKKAKTAHPDAGGDPAAFEQIAKAHAVLISPTRRDRYDRTGEVDEDVNGPAHAAMALIGEMMMQIVEQIGDRPVHVDLVQKMREAMDDRIHAIARDRTAAEKKAARLEGIAARFKAKRGRDNILKMMVLSRAASARSIVDSADRVIASIELAREMIEGLSFDAEDPAPAPAWRQFSMGGINYASTSTGV